MTRQALIDRLILTSASNETICHVMHVWDEVTVMPMDELLKYCCMATGITPKEAKLKSRKGVNVRTRQLFCFAGKDWYTLIDMGRFLKRDHTTIIHSRKVARGLYKSEDPLFMFDYENLQRAIKGLEVKPLTPKRIPTPRKKRVEPVRYESYIIDTLTGDRYESGIQLYKHFEVRNHPSFPRFNKKFNNRFDKIKVAIVR